MKISIVKNTFSYSPEIYAYADFIRKYDINVEIGLANEVDNKSDAVMLLMGFVTSFHYKRFKNCKHIHEYSSLSTEPFPKIKDFLKSKLNVKPYIRIFNSKSIKDNLRFNDNTPYIFRDTGVDKSFFNAKNQKKKDFDIVYSGSMSHRKGLINCLIFFLEMGFSILVVGEFNNRFYKKLKNYKNIEFSGRVPLREVSNLYSKAIYGLNFTPDQYPYNIQNSTKTKEYCASGLKVISNYYSWVKNFSYQRNATFLWTKDIINRDDIENHNYVTPNVTDLEWDNILNKCNFHKFIIENI